MSLNDFFTPAVIASITSLTVSALALYQFFSNRRFLENQFDKTNNRAFTSKLYDLRLQNYPRAFELMDALRREKGGLMKVETVRFTCEELGKWKSGIVTMIISNEAKESYIVFNSSLTKNPSHINEYSAEQVEKIINAMRDFRGQLRRDLGFMFREEKERRASGSKK